MEMESEQDLHRALLARLVEENLYSELLRVLKQDLEDTKWLDMLKDQARESARSKDNVTLQGLVSEITPKARDTFPEGVKEELIGRVRDFISRNVEE